MKRRECLCFSSVAARSCGSIIPDFYSLPLSVMIFCVLYKTRVKGGIWNLKEKALEMDNDERT